MCKSTRNAIIVVAVFIIIAGALIAVVFYPRAGTLQKARDAVNDCDDIEFSGNYASWEIQRSDIDGFNAEPLESRRQAVLAMLDAGGLPLKWTTHPIGSIKVKRKGQTILTIDLLIFGVFVVDGRAFRVEYEGDKTLTRLFSYIDMEQDQNHANILDDAKKMLATCENIEFLKEEERWWDIEFLIEEQRWKLDVERLNAESIEAKRKIIGELFSAGKSPEKNCNMGERTGMIYLKKEGKVVLAIMLCQAGYRMRLLFFEVPRSACESSETLQRLLCPEEINGEPD